VETAIAYLEALGHINYWPIERLPNGKPFAKGRKFKSLDFCNLQLDVRLNSYTPEFIQKPDQPRRRTCGISVQLYSLPRPIGQMFQIVGMIQDVLAIKFGVQIHHQGKPNFENPVRTFFCDVVTGSLDGGELSHN